MDTPTFKLTCQDLQAYASAHQYAQMMFVSAGDDYVAARCLILNELFYGFTLFSQSIEKFLKAYIFLETGKPTTLKGRELHSPFKLKQELQTRKDYNLDRHDDLLHRLYGHFQQRYFDNANQSRSMRASELAEFDDLWVYLLDRVPFPIEVKYRLKFMANLFDERVVRFWPKYRFWATHENKALAPMLPNMNATYSAIEKHLYP
jgi:hypothetical protein